LSVSGFPITGQPVAYTSTGIALGTEDLLCTCGNAPPPSDTGRIVAIVLGVVAAVAVVVVIIVLMICWRRRSALNAVTSVDRDDGAYGEGLTQSTE
jgi:hypothetical protein